MEIMKELKLIYINCFYLNINNWENNDINFFINILILFNDGLYNYYYYYYYYY